jgi:hypothetical protein
MTTQHPIITPASKDDDERRHETAGDVQRELSGVYVNPAHEAEVVDTDAETTQEWETESQGPAPRSGEHTRGEELGTPHLAERDSSHMNERWQQVQAQFVDDPRKAVGEAHALVGELVQRIVDGFAKERDGLERQWSEGDNVSTEDLRLCLQNYRAFFSRLLPSANMSQLKK